MAKICAESGAYILSVTTTPKAWLGTAKLAQGNKRIKTALGLHPQIAHERIGELGLFDALLSETRYVGEIGLDGSPEYKIYWKQQMQVFEHILGSSARAGGKILSIHSRLSTSSVLDTLCRYPDAGVPVLHWFSGTKTELKRAVEIGCWFSVGPAMLLGKKGRELIAAMPKNRIITETDGPFAMIKKKALNPADVNAALEQLAACWQVDFSEASFIVFESFRNLIS